MPEGRAGADGATPGRAMAVVLLAGPLLFLSSIAAVGIAEWETTRGWTLSAASVEGRFAWLLSTGQAAFATSLVLLAASVDRCFPGRGRAGPVVLVVGGVAALGVVGFGCGRGCLADGMTRSEAVHVAAAAVTSGAALLAPLLLARRVGVTDGWRGYRHLCRATAALVALGLLAWLAARATAWDGIVERGLVGCWALWVTATAARVTGHTARHRVAGRPVRPSLLAEGHLLDRG